MSEWAIDWGFIVKEKPPMQHVINLEVKNIN